MSLARLHIHDLPRKILVQPGPWTKRMMGLRLRIVGSGGAMTFEMFMNGRREQAARVRIRGQAP